MDAIIFMASGPEAVHFLYRIDTRKGDSADGSTVKVEKKRYIA